jgi:ribosomal protein S18 acetylase RimI-like enzyme
METLITTNVPRSRLDAVVDFMIQPTGLRRPHEYHDIVPWAHKAHGEIVEGVKIPLVTFEEQAVAGVVLFQAHKTKPDVVEGKHISVAADQQGRRIGGFMVRNAEIEAMKLFPGRPIIEWDTKATNRDMQAFLRSQGYNESGQEFRYGVEHGLDVVYSKVLTLSRRARP